MLNGDAYAKKFGEPTNALGEVDGTNGEDFFRVWIICENEKKMFKSPFGCILIFKNVYEPFGCISIEYGCAKNR